MARATKDKTGQRFGRLTVIGRDTARDGVFWLCQCDCGKMTTALTGHLNAGMRVSCGCRLAESKRKHGLSHSPEYRAWENAKSRCRNPNNRKYSIYGGRGIQMCKRWLDSFENFYSDMGPRPSARYSLDRIDGNKGYEPENCRWATLDEQNNNRSFNRLIGLRGERVTVAQASKMTGIPHATIISRLSRGWTEEEALGDG